MRKFLWHFLPFLMSVKGIKRFLKTFASFVGPGYMVSIGYFDPGNWVLFSVNSRQLI
jgi:Mn2+/Fe2+ NRAMP family transporter